MPDYCGTHDASGTGVGEIWHGGQHALPPTVWQYEWPKEVKAQLVSFKNPKGTIKYNALI